jgi:hypothetical protein
MRMTVRTVKRTLKSTLKVSGVHLVGTTLRRQTVKNRVPAPAQKWTQLTLFDTMELTTMKEKENV